MNFEAVQEAGVYVYGDLSFRDKKSPVETWEQMQFFSILRRKFPRLGGIAVHIKNERLAYGGQFRTIAKDRAQGLVKGASDIIIPGDPAFVCELKRKDHTLSRWQDGQESYLMQCALAGAFTCIALGHEAALQAVREWDALS